MFPAGRLVVRAEAEEFDFDSALAKVADKFEKAGEPQLQLRSA